MNNASDRIKLKIKELMKAQNLTEYSLAKAADLTQTCIANWYSARNYKPSVPALESVCEVLGISMAELFCMEEDEMVPVNNQTRELLAEWQKLSANQKQALMMLLRSI